MNFKNKVLKKLYSSGDIKNDYNWPARSTEMYKERIPLWWLDCCCNG